MPMQFSSWEARDADSSGPKIGFGLLGLCRAYRGMEGVKDARYWVQGYGRLVMLVETEMEVQPATLVGPEITKAVFALGELARQVDTQTWGDPRPASEGMQAAGVT